MIQIKQVLDLRKESFNLKYNGIVCNIVQIPPWRITIMFDSHKYLFINKNYEATSKNYWKTQLH